MDVEKRVKQVIIDQLQVKKCELTDDLVSDLGADSLDLVELIMCLEEEFDLEISDAQAEQCVFVKDVIDLLKDLTNN